MSLTDVKPVVSGGSGGGGGLGGLLGAVIGGAASVLALPTGGSSLAAIPAALGGAAAGSGLGAMAGNLVDAPEAPEASDVVPQNKGGGGGPISAMQNHPEVQYAKIKDAQNALKTGAVQGPQADQYHQLLTQADQKLRMTLGR